MDVTGSDGIADKHSEYVVYLGEHKYSNILYPNAIKLIPTIENFSSIGSILDRLYDDA